MSGEQNKFTDSGVTLTPEQKKARSRRNLVIAGLLAGFIVLVFVTTVLRLSANIASGG